MVCLFFAFVCLFVCLSDLVYICLLMDASRAVRRDHLWSDVILKYDDMMTCVLTESLKGLQVLRTASQSGNTCGLYSPDILFASNICFTKQRYE